MIKKLRNLFKSKNFIVPVDEDANMDVAVDFYIPKKETIKALSNHQPLTEDQIDDYINYIKKNYFVSRSNSDLIFQFCGEFMLNSSDEDAFATRAQDAFENVREDLLEGKTPHVIDALWITSKAYVDDLYVESKRIVAKVFDDEKPQLDIRIAKCDPRVNEEISNLKSSLKKVATKEVANTSINML